MASLQTFLVPDDMDNSGRNDLEPQRQVQAHKSLGAKFLVAFTALFAMAFLTAGLISIKGLPFSSFDGWEGSAKREAVSSLNLIADLKKEHLMLWFRERRGDIQVIAGSQIIEVSLPPLISSVRSFGSSAGNDKGLWARIRNEDAFKRIAGFLSLVQNASAQHRTARYRVIRIVDAGTGLVLVSTNDAEIGATLDEHGQSSIEAVRTGKDYVSDVSLSDHHSAPHIDITHSVINPQGAVIGVVMMEIAIEDVVGPFLYTRGGLGETGEALLVDGRGRILMSLRHPLPDGSVARVMEYQITAKPALFATLGREGTIESKDYRGHEVIAAYRHLRISPDWGWGMVVKIDRAQLFASMNEGVRYSVGTGVMGIFLVVVLSVLLTRQLTHPLRHMTKAAARLAAGDRSVRTQLKTGDEIGRLSSIFDLMAERIDNTWKNLEYRSAELDAANKELESFAYSVAHDLRAPLRAIDGFSQALVEDYGEQLDGEAKIYLGYLREGSQEMGRLIDDLLKLSRATRGEISREDLDLSQLTAEIVEDLRQTDPERNVVTDIAPGIVVNADPRLLRVVMENLLGNAWKFTAKEGEAYIEFGAERVHGKLRCFVRDNGVGFDMAYRNKLFAPFRRLHSHDDFEGTGIGLSTVQRIINRHGGTIRAEGIVGAGACFTFELDPAQHDRMSLSDAKQP